jgi:hypothetical protein
VAVLGPPPVGPRLLRGGLVPPWPPGHGLVDRVEKRLTVPDVCVRVVVGGGAAACIDEARIDEGDLGRAPVAQSARNAAKGRPMGRYLLPGRARH